MIQEKFSGASRRGEGTVSMLPVFVYAFNAVAPILLLVLVGYVLQRKRVFSVDFFKHLNTLAFRYCFPPLMFMNLYGLGSLREIDLGLAACLVGSSFVLTLAGFLVARLATKERDRKGVLVQATFRSNYAIIGLPLSEGLAGAAGIAVTASMQAPTVIYFNVVSVLVLCLYAQSGGGSQVKKVLRGLARNPLLQGIVAGLIALTVREFIPVTASGELAFSLSRDLPWLYTALDYLSRVATPLALIALGGQFKFSDVPGIRRELVAGTAAKLLLGPVVGFAITFWFRSKGWIMLDSASMSALIAAFGSPVAVSSAPMAAEMGADGKLASQIVVWTSFLSMGTIFLLAVIFRAAGLL